MPAACPELYRPRKPRDSPLYRLVERHCEEVEGVWEERFESAYGFWRGFVDDVVYAFLACGDFEGGPALRRTHPAAGFLAPFRILRAQRHHGAARRS